jgi:hypothetical protein
MPNEFLSELDRWLLAVLQEKLYETECGAEPRLVTEADLARMISDYVLLSVAQQPASCWTACDIDQATDEQILAKTTFGEELLAAGFMGAVCELGGWCGDEGVAYMEAQGVPHDDALEIATGVEIVSEKLAARGQSLVQRLPHRGLTEIAQ